MLVYPKLFRLATPPIVSRVPWGDQRAAPEVAGDPSRVAGVREYRPGDALRHVDWRATARSNALLIREFEPSATWRIAVFADVRVPRQGTVGRADVAEFLIAVTASVVADMAGKGVATGLYSSGTVRGRPTVAATCERTPGALPAMLECWRWFPPATRRTSIGELLLSESGHLGGAASVVVVATDYPQPTLAALAAVRRRLPVTAIWIRADDGHPPPHGAVDVVREVTYRDDWRTVDVLEFAA